MSKHTPGPWTVTDEDDFDGLAIEAAGREGEYVPVAHVPVDYDDRPEREANAALIARAPEMADEIATLRAEIEKLRAALHEAADELDAYYRAEYCGDHPYSKRKLAEAMRNNPARAALGGK